MERKHPFGLAALVAVGLLAGCATATRPVNPPIALADQTTGYRYEVRDARSEAARRENLVILAFSGGGTRAAAFSYGVLEYLRDTRIEDARGRSVRLLDSIDLIAGVSGGSFTALAYGLYGEKLFDVYETAFLKRDVQGEIIARVFNPANWGPLGSPGWGRSELAAGLYDEILFKGATYADLDRAGGPTIMVVTTDLTTGSRFAFTQAYFDVICSDLHAVPLSRAASASSAVPVLLSAVTINNYGGTCGQRLPPWAARFIDDPDPPRPAARAIRTLRSAQDFSDSEKRPFLHLVDGGVADNIGLRGVLDTLELSESLRHVGAKSPLDHLKRIVVLVVNSLSDPPTDWDRAESPPGPVATMLKAAGTPIDRNSYETVESLRDTAARWRIMRTLRDSKAMADNTDPAIKRLLSGPDAEIYAIDVSFTALADAKEREYLNQQPTTFVLPPEAVDRLRAAAGKIIQSSPEFARLLKDLDARVVPKAGPAAPSRAPAP
jgi:NTE family protein